MAFTVRTSPTGTGNSIADIGFADEYFGDRGNSSWAAASDPDKQTWLIQATDYLDIRFGPRYTDDVLNGTSEFPLVDGTTIPVKLAQACCEYAIRAKGAPLAPDPTVDASGVTVVKTRSKVGPIESEYQIAGPHSPALFRPYPAADARLIGLLIPSARTVYR